MATFLTTRRMSPELRARVEVSVRGESGPARARLRPRTVMLIRLVTVTTIASCLAWFWFWKRGIDRELEESRAALLARWNREAAAVTPRQKNLVQRVEPWLQRACGTYEGDWIAESLELDGGLVEVLKRPTVYVRAPLEKVASPAHMRRSAVNSGKDALVLCLVAPPEERTERALLRKARSAFSGDERMKKATAHVQRLGAAVAGLPLLDTAWRARVLEAKNQPKLDSLRRAFDRAPIHLAKQAAQAKLLLLAIDERGDRSAPPELDGERPHNVRVEIIDLIANEPLLRMRRRVDPGWLSENTRVEFARVVDSCTLGYDIHQAVAAK